VNEENKAHKEFLVNEGSEASLENKDRKVLMEPLDVMEEMAKMERMALLEFVEKMVKTEQ
jgi:hypothetical protein